MSTERTGAAPGRAEKAAHEETGGPSLIEALLGDGVRAVFTTREGGVSSAPFDSLNLGFHVGDDDAAVATNRQRLRAAIGHPIAYLDQIHSARVVTRLAQPTTTEREAERADAHVTDQSGLALAIMTADCAPVLLADPVARVVGAAHAGRAGLVAGVIAHTVAAMAAIGGQPARMRAAIGPTVCGRCYEVPEAMAAEAAASLPPAAAKTRAGTPAIDIPAAIQWQLGRLGVGLVERVGGCTMEEAAWFSHRRAGGRTGRMAGLIWLT